MATRSLVVGTKSPVVAGILSFLIPGAGSIYAGRLGRGLATFFFGIPIFITVILLFMPLMGIWALLLWLLIPLEAAIHAAKVGECPFCRGKVDKRATICPHCQRDLLSASPPAGNLISNSP